MCINLLTFVLRQHIDLILKTRSCSPIDQFLSVFNRASHSFVLLFIYFEGGVSKCQPQNLFGISTGNMCFFLTCFVYRGCRFCFALLLKLMRGILFQGHGRCEAFCTSDPAVRVTSDSGEPAFQRDA